MGIGNRIIKNIERPSRALIESFSGLPVANIGDCMNRLAAVSPDISSMNGVKVCGTAFTVRVPEGDNLMFHKAMDLAKPGDVIVIDAGGGKERAILGELMVSYCMKRGISGLVVDGYIRDADAIEEMDYPVFARGYTPNGPYKNGPGEINVPVTIGGKIINPGDIIIGDKDGLLALSPYDAGDVLEAVRVLEKKEEELLSKILEEGIYERPWVDEKLKALACEEI